MDELGVEAAKIQQDIDAIKGKQVVILEREKQEMALAAGNSMFASMLPAYRLRVKWQIDRAQQEIQAKDEMLAEVRTRLQEAYVEKSKFEQLIEQARVRSDAERAAHRELASFAYVLTWHAHGSPVAFGLAEHDVFECLHAARASRRRVLATPVITPKPSRTRPITAIHWFETPRMLAPNRMPADRMTKPSR